MIPVLKPAANAIAIVGLVLLAIGAIWFLITVFRESVIWGVVCLFTGVASLIFLVLYWRETKRPFFLELAGGVLILAGKLLGAGTS